jgi:hypothetical protein
MVTGGKLPAHDVREQEERSREIEEEQHVRICAVDTSSLAFVLASASTTRGTLELNTRLFFQELQASRVDLELVLGLAAVCSQLRLKLRR